MRNQIIIFFSVLWLSGCQSLVIMSASKLEPSSGDQEWTAAIPITGAVLSDRDGDNKPVKSLWTTLFGDGPEVKTYKDLCTPTNLAPVAAAALTALGGVAWDLAVDAANTKVSEIQDRSSKTWSATWSGTPSKWQETNCVALARIRGKDNPAPQMVILLGLKSFDTGKTGVSAFQVTPILVASKTSLALTADEGGGKGSVGLSVATVASAFKEGELKENSVDAVSIGGVLVGEPTGNPKVIVMPVGKPPFNFSKPLAYSDIADVYMKFSIVETGSFSGLDAKSKAEIKAVADALGPIAKDALKKKLEKMSAE